MRDDVAVALTVIAVIASFVGLGGVMVYGFQINHVEECKVTSVYIVTDNGYGAQSQRMSLDCPSGTFHENVSCIGAYKEGDVVKVDFHNFSSFQPTVEADKCK